MTSLKICSFEHTNLNRRHLITYYKSCLFLNYSVRRRHPNSIKN